MAAQAGIAMQVAASFLQHRDLAVHMQQTPASRARIEQGEPPGS